MERWMAGALRKLICSVNLPRSHSVSSPSRSIIWDANLQPYSKLASTLKNRDPPDQDPHQVPSITPPVAIKSFMKYLRNDHKDTLLRHYMLTCDKRGFHSQDSAWIKIALQYADAAGNPFRVRRDI